MDIINHGVIISQRQSDYVGGTLPYEVRNPSGDWTPYLPPGEWQRNNFFDTFACVTFSFLNSVETQYKFLTGIERNFSDRELAKASDTIPNVGNSLWHVADTARAEGIVDESVWPAPENYTELVYYASIPQDVKDQAKLFLKDWEIKYEWIDTSKESLMHHIKHAPIQVVLPGHAVLDFLTTQQIINYFDSYAPFQKQTEQILWAMKIVLNRRIKMLDKDDVRFLYALEGFHDEAGVEFWGDGTHTLKDYKKARVPDKVLELTKLVLI